MAGNRGDLRIMKVVDSNSLATVHDAVDSFRKHEKNMTIQASGDDKTKVGATKVYKCMDI